MQQFRADLHIHSRFSRATSGRLNIRHLAAWARVKGLDVLGTGDFTHPEWRAELAGHLVLDESSGLYRLRDPRGGSSGAAVIISFSCVFYFDYLLSLVSPVLLCFSAVVRCGATCAAGRWAAVLPYLVCVHPG